MEKVRGERIEMCESDGLVVGQAGQVGQVRGRWGPL